MESLLATAMADRYRIERELGAGGMATVYLARDIKHDCDVAVTAYALIGDCDKALAALERVVEARPLRMYSRARASSCRS